MGLEPTTNRTTTCRSTNWATTTVGMARFELATFTVSEWQSNHWYTCLCKLWRRWDSNPWPSACKADALAKLSYNPKIVEWTGLEPAISWSQITNLNQLGHHSICWTCQTRTDNTSARNSRVTITPKSNLTCVDFHTPKSNLTCTEFCRTYQIRTDNVRAKTSCVNQLHQSPI